MTEKKQTYYEKNKERLLRESTEKRNAKYEGMVEGYDYITCKECGFRSSELATHIIRKHGMTIDEYKLKHNVDAVKSQSSKDRVKGDKNPAYQHGGKFSPFSDKFIYADETNKEELFAKVKQTKIDNNSDPTKFEYWLEKCNGNHEEATKLYKDRQTTFTLEKCIDKHGIVEGFAVFKDRQDKWQATLTDKSEEEKIRINRLKVNNSVGAISKAEKELNAIFLKENIEIEIQFPMVDSSNKKQYIFDFKFENKLIEYHGDYWHCNPKVYTADHYNGKLHMTSEQKWNVDANKNKYAIDNGYVVLVIWERDFKNDKQGTIDKCLNFLRQ